MMQSICVDQEINLIKNKTNWNVKQRKWRKKAGDFWKKNHKEKKQKKRIKSLEYIKR